MKSDSREFYKSLKIGGITINIYFEEELLEEGMLGFSDFSGYGSEICLHPGLKNNPELFQTTLLHELFHQVSAIYSLDLEEVDVSVLAIAAIEIQNGLGEGLGKLEKTKKTKKT